MVIKSLLSEYQQSKTIVEHKELFVRIIVGLLIDNNGGSL